ncbi:unnamed protein product [Fraxinus pennsylvanica]|uniref:Uncharacterized protein n=1 Tax=Fraxinus pennsylvanica TaxID=56036 RepID=A0AAD2ABW4_9LAMI|nr:unnamed protein product [Fraxinus pennsylvanica]
MCTEARCTSVLVILPTSDTIHISEVWNGNLECEFALIRGIVDDFPYIAMDTEFSELLTHSGIDFEKNIEQGIDAYRFSELMMSSGIVLNDNVHWVTFHSAYDFGFALRTGRRFRARRMLLLFKTPMGFSLFKVLDEGKLFKVEISSTSESASLMKKSQRRPKVDLIPAIPKEEAGTNLFNMNSDDKNKVDAGGASTQKVGKCVLRSKKIALNI